MRKHKMLNKVAVGLLSFAASYTHPAWADTILVVSNSARKVQLSREDVKGIFLGTRTLVDDWRVVPLDQAPGSTLRKKFYETIAGKTKTQMKVYWAEQIFSGKARAPRSVAEETSVVQQILNNPDAIGYVTDSADTSKLNIVLKLE